MNPHPLLLTGFLVALPPAAVVLGLPDPVGSRSAAAATAFLATLNDAQRGKAAFAFDAAERTKWHFVPGVYPGVSFAELKLPQKRAFHRLLHTVLSGAGYHKTTAIMKLEDTLRELAEARGRKAPHRDPGRYSVAVFGTPDAKKPWGFRLQGHHLSWNFTSIDGRIAATTPAFLGSNPAEVRQGPHAGLRALPDEEDFGFELLGMLDAAQREVAILSAKAPSDVLWGPGKKRAAIGEPAGLAFAKMTGAQRELAWDLVRIYVRNLKGVLAGPELQKIRKAGRNEIHFAWMGATQRGKGHYYRLHGPTFAIEYDNTQNGANHVHTVWHDPTSDFGIDLLKQHYENAHKKK